jgi:hypothetical protein
LPIVESSYTDEPLDQLLDGNIEEAFDHLTDSLQESVRVDLTDSNAIKKLVFGEKVSAIVSLSRSLQTCSHAASLSYIFRQPDACPASIFAWQ